MDKAEKLVTKSLKINQGANNVQGLVADYRNLGNISLQKKDWSGAEKNYLDALELNTKAENKPEMAEDNRNQYNLYLQKEDWGNAEKYALRSFEIAEEIKDVQNILACLLYTSPRQRDS